VEAAARSSRPGTSAVVILGSLAAFGPLSIDMYLPGLPGLSGDLGASATAAQATLSSCMLGLAVGQLIAGPLSDTYGRRRPLLIGLVGYAVVSALCAAAPSIALLIVLRLIQGAVGAAGLVISRAVIRDLYEGAAAARAFALMMLVIGVAPVCAPLIGAQLLHVMSWRGIFLVLAGIGATLAVVTATWLQETLAAANRRPTGLATTLRTFHALLHDRTFMPYASSFALATSAMFAYIAGSSFVLEEIYGVSPQGFGFVFAANSTALVIAAQVSGRLVARTGPTSLLAAGLVLGAASGTGVFVASLVDAPLAVLLALLMLLVGSIGLVTPNATALSLAHQSRAAGSASALLGLGQGLLGAAVMPLAGLGGKTTAVPMGALMAVCSVAGLVTYVRYRRAPDPRPSS
jgi:DHA1 family bicyclomycin/chloramphenicol resistance-like MFS transporter